MARNISNVYRRLVPNEEIVAESVLDSLEVAEKAQQEEMTTESYRQNFKFITDALRSLYAKREDAQDKGW